MSVSNVFYESTSFSSTIPALSQFRESHQENHFDGQNIIVRDSHESLVRASSFISYLAKNLNTPKGSKSPLQALLERSLHLPNTEENKSLFSEITKAFFKQKGYLSRLFSNESWEEWFENRTALGRVAAQLRNCFKSRAKVCSFTEEMNPQLIQKANEESSVLLKGLGSLDVKRTSKGFCLFGLTSGIAASFLLENPLPLLLGLSECFTRAYAQQKVGSEFQINTFTNNSQSGPSVTSFSNGNFVVTWQSYGQDGSGYGIYGQLFDGNSTKIGSEFRANSYTNNSQRDPSVTSFSNGNFVVTWESMDQDGSGHGIYGQLFVGNGSKIGSEFQANTYTTNWQRSPSVVSLANGNFVVTWMSNGQDGSLWGVYCQLFDGNGSTIRSEFRANSYTTDTQSSPSVASFSNGNFVVTWQSFGQDGSTWGVFGQLFDENAAKIGNEFQVNTYTTSEQSKPSVTGLQEDNFVFTWRSYGQDGSDYGVYGQLFDGNGSKIGSEFRANSYITYDQLDSSVASFSNGNFVVTWNSWLQDGSDYGVYGQLFNGNGTKIGSEFRANSYTPNYQSSPSVACFSNGNFVVTWQSSQDGSGVYGQIFNDFLVSSTTITSTSSSVSSSTTEPSTTRTTSSKTSSVSSSTTEPSTTRTTSSKTSSVSSSTMSAIGRTRTSVNPSSSRTTVPSTTKSITTSNSRATPSPTTSTIATMNTVSSTPPTSSISSSTFATTPTSSIPKASSPPKRTGLITWISLGVGGLICFCVAPLSFLLLRKRKSQTGAHFSEETGVRSTAFKLEPVVQRHKVIGRKFFQLSTLVREEAEEIYLQTGHLIPFPEGQKKLPYVIGSGQFGKIKVAQRIKDETYVASKQVKGAENMRASEAEAQMQQAAAGENVLPIYNTIQLEEALYHFMPLAGLGDGSTIQSRLAVLNQSPLAHTILKFIAQNILTGLQTIHSKGIYHLDIKPDNLVFTKNGTAYITDFGCAQRPESRHLTRKALGDNRYFSPVRLRACQEGTFDAEKADMWAAGLTLLQIFHNKDPLELLNMPHRLAARVERCNQAHFDEQLQQFIEAEKGSIWWVIRGLMDTNPKTSLSAKKALQASCFHGLGKTEQERAFEELRRETFAHHRDVEPSAVNLGDYGWLVQRVPEEEKARAYSSEQNQQFYGYKGTPDLYQFTPDHVTASSSSSGKLEIPYALTPDFVTAGDEKH